MCIPYLVFFCFFHCCFSFLTFVYSNFIFVFGCWSFEPWFLYKYIQQLVTIDDKESCVVVEFWPLRRLTWGGSGASKRNVARRNKTSVGPGDRLKLLSKLRIWGPIKLVSIQRRACKVWTWKTVNIHVVCYIMQLWPSWLQCKCEWWSVTSIQKCKWILHNYFSSRIN